MLNFLANDCNYSCTLGGGHYPLDLSSCGLREGRHGDYLILGISV